MVLESSSAESRTVVAHRRTDWAAPTDLMARLDLDKGKRLMGTRIWRKCARPEQKTRRPVTSPWRRTYNEVESRG